MRYLYSYAILLAASIAVSGCQTTSMTPPPFNGLWRMYEDDQGRFIDFAADKVTMGDKSSSRTSSYTFELADESEPLYDVVVPWPDGPQTFQLYYEQDTISILSGDSDIDGLYEIIIDVTPQ